MMQVNAIALILFLSFTISANGMFSALLADHEPDRHWWLWLIVVVLLIVGFALRMQELRA